MSLWLTGDLPSDIRARIAAQIGESTPTAGDWFRAIAITVAMVVPLVVPCFLLRKLSGELLEKDRPMESVLLAALAAGWFLLWAFCTPGFTTAIHQWHTRESTGKGAQDHPCSAR